MPAATLLAVVVVVVVVFPTTDFALLADSTFSLGAFLFLDCPWSWFGTMPILAFHFWDLSGLARKREEMGASTTEGEAGGGATVGTAGGSARGEVGRAGAGGGIGGVGRGFTGWWGVVTSLSSTTFSEDIAPSSAEDDDSCLGISALVRPSWPPPIAELLPLAYSRSSWFSCSRISWPVGIAGSKEGCLVPLGEIACSCLKSAFCHALYSKMSD